MRERRNEMKEKKVKKEEESEERKESPVHFASHSTNPKSKVF